MIELEKQGWEALSKGRDVARGFYESLFLNETVMAFPGGMMVGGKEKILSSIDSQPWKFFQIEDSQVISLSENASAIVYKVTAKREGSDPYIALISSMYTCRNGQWKLALHQQTPE